MALDVGFGRGGFLLELSRRHPQWNVLGVEIRAHLVEDVLRSAREQGIANVFAILANVNLHLDALIPNRALAFVSINFPDPWYKKRHHKRRVVQPAWLTLLAAKMQDDAQLHVMTDYEPIAQEIRERLEQHPQFTSVHPHQPFAQESTTGIATEREVSHLARGHSVYRLCYRRRADEP